MGPNPETDAKGTLIAIGGHEDKSGERVILKRVAELLGSGRIVVATVGSSEPDELWREYRHQFKELGLEAVHLHLDSREEALDPASREVMEGAGGVFFTGGDQLAISTKLGGTELCGDIHRLYFEEGGLVAGTSAGASILTETMIIGGDAGQSHRINMALQLAPGLGFLPATVIDQHFAERGRISRLLGIVAENPRALGIGIDENTAIELRGGREFRVFGDGAVYVVDGRPITHTNISEEDKDRTISIFGVRLHVMSKGDCFDLATREPVAGGPPKVRKKKKEEH